jgi:uncharacterized protein (TIGR00369 family)
MPGLYSLDKIEDLIKHQPILNHLGVKLNNVERGLCEIEFDIKEFHKQGLGYIHGGITATMADTAAGWAVYSMLSLNTASVTSDLNIKYLRPGTGEKCIAIGKVLKPGKRFYFSEADVFTEQNGVRTHIARASGTFPVIEINKPL